MDPTVCFQCNPKPAYRNRTLTAFDPVVETWPIFLGGRGASNEGTYPIEVLGSCPPKNFKIRALKWRFLHSRCTI